MTTLTVNEPMRSELPAETASAGRVVVSAHSYTDADRSIWPPPPVPEASFESERAAFRLLLPMLFSVHPGEFVIVSGGVVVDHDRSRRTLLRRFFSDPARATVPVYVGFVGPARVARQVSPVRVRRGA